MLVDEYESEQQRQELLDCLLEYSTEVFFRVDTQWQITALNRQAEILCQQRQEQLLGRIVWEAVPALIPLIPSLTRQETSQEHECHVYTTFSSTLNAWFALRLFPISTGMALFLREISCCKRAEQERQADESLAQAIFDSVDVMMAVLDSNGTICLLNEAWRRQQRERCTADQFERTGVGMNYLDVCQHAQGECAEEAPAALAGIQAVLQGTSPSFILEYPCFCATSQSWYMVRVTPLPQNKGAVVAHIDITERKLLDQQKDTFISMAAHELRTPLTALKGMVQLEKRKCEKQEREDQRSTFVKLETQIERLSSLVSELLDVSRMQTGTLEYTEEVLDFDVLIQEAVETVQRVHPEHTLNIHGSPTHATILADRSKLNQVFTNLLNNAIKYSPHADAVDISLEVAQGSVLVRVRDYGIGISQEHLGHIFERFYRVNTSKHHHVTGLGMGLYIVQEIVKHHRGTITVTSEVGRGSTFSVLFPLCERSFSPHK